MSSIKIIDNGKIEIIMRQTNYDKNLATKKLLEWDNDYMNVIREYMNPRFNEKKVEKKRSVQQNILSEIRYFMDNVSVGYEKREKEKVEIKKKKDLEEINLKKIMLERILQKKKVLSEIKSKKN
jgi:hypothetical protein